MAKEISRRDFIKGVSAGAVGVGLLGSMSVLSGCGDKAQDNVAPVDTNNDASQNAATDALESVGVALYTPGTYSASARGMDSNVEVTMTFDEYKITDVKIDCSGETENLGAKIGDEMSQKILDAQSADIDAVSGVTITSKAIHAAAAECIAQATGIPVAEEAKPETNADWLGTAPEVAEADIKDTIDCEVLVIGAGNGGLFAAASAAENGAKTILVERFAHDMASGIRDTFAAIDSTEQKADGANVKKSVALNHLCNWSQGYTRRSLAGVWADYSGETVDWYDMVLRKDGLRFAHEIDGDHPSNYEYLEVGHSVQWDANYYEQRTMDAVLSYVASEGLPLETHYETTMIKLEKNDAGRVTGIIAKNASDEYVRYNASNGVIVATGGYGNNEDMIRALQPWTIEQIGVNYNKSGSKGDGIKACLWAGAVMDSVHTSMIFDRACIKPDQTGKVGESVPGGWFWMGSQPFLKVNLKGERFMNEYQPYDYILHQAAEQPGRTYCTVWDSTYHEDVEKFATHGCSRLCMHENGTFPVFPMEMVDGMLAGLMADGYIVEANTVEELAEKLNIPVDSFVKTVDRYNDLCAKGEDEDFGKEPYRLASLDTAPFYGTRQSGGYFICTMDGIQIDDTMHAVDKDFKAIPGLYVVGDASGNYFAGSYPNLMSGAAAGRTATFGRLAGKYAAEGIDK